MNSTSLDETTELKYHYHLAGLDIATNRPLLPLVSLEEPSRGPRLEVWFGSDDVVREGESKGWESISVEGNYRAAIRDDGAVAVTGERDFSEGDYLVQAKFIAPFASALQGQIILHGGAVGWEGKAFAFIGASGVGKSTLVRALSRDRGMILADDLLPVHLVDGRIYVPGPSGRWALVAVDFLRPRRGTHLQEKSNCRREGLEQFLSHGFGEYTSPLLWRRQFEMYGHLVDLVPTRELVLPDDLEALPEIVEWWWKDRWERRERNPLDD